MKPDVVEASAEYDAIIKDIYLADLREQPVSAVRLYLAKTIYTVKHFAALLLLIAVGALLAWRRRGPHRTTLALLAVATLPILGLGLLPAVLVMPMLYYFTELVAGLGFLSALALGGAVWALSTLPSRVRRNEHVRARERAVLAEPRHGRGLSVVVPRRTGGGVLPEGVAELAGALGADDEVVVVGHGPESLPAVPATGEWPYACRLVLLDTRGGEGDALRTGVLASRGSRVLLAAEDQPVGRDLLEAFRELPDTTAVAVGSSGSRAGSWAVRELRSALLHSSVDDPQGPIWVDGTWVRSFAAVSQETGRAWRAELVLAAEQQHLPVHEVPAPGSADRMDERSGLRDGVGELRAVLRLALRKDAYAGQDWRQPRPALPATSASAADPRG